VAAYPLSVQITTRDSIEQREIQQNYIVTTSRPRWELAKIFFHAILHIRFR
jgi:hypothetical protein